MCVLLWQTTDNGISQDWLPSIVVTIPKLETHVPRPQVLGVSYPIPVIILSPAQLKGASAFLPSHG